MTDLNLLQSGENAAERGDHLAALQAFLRLKEQKFDLVRCWDIKQCINTIRLRDVDLDLTSEIGVLTENGTFATFSLSQDAGEATTLEGISNFRYFTHGPDVSVLTLHERRLSVYVFDAAGAKLHLKKVRDLPHNSAIEPIDIACKGQIFVSTTDGSIYQYNSVTFEQEFRFDAGAVVRRLNAKFVPEDDRETRNLLLGVLRDGGLRVFNTGGARWTRGDIIGQSWRYVDACIADLNNDGMDDIIAITQNGKLHVYDWDCTEKVKYGIDCPDEFYGMYCSDIDGDGNLEVLVGAKSNRIYAFCIEPECGLRIKWEFEMRHRVCDLWVGDIRPNDKALVAGLGNGKLQVFRLYSSREVNHRVDQAFQNLRNSTSVEELQQKLVRSNCPEVVRFGLDKIASMISCSEMIAFLKVVEETGNYLVNLQILSQMKPILDKFANATELLEYSAEFLQRLFDGHPDLPTCERICATLEAILRGNAGSSLHLLEESEYFNRERRRRRVFHPDRAKHVEQLAAEGKPKEANRELATLRLLKLDLLGWYKTNDMIDFVHHTVGDECITYTTTDQRLGAVNLRTQEVFATQTFLESEIHCRPIEGDRWGYIVSHGCTLHIHKKQAVVRTKKLHCPVKCVAATYHQRQLYLVAGLECGEIVVEGPEGEVVLAVPSKPAGIALLVRGDCLELFVFTVDDKLYHEPDVGVRLHQGELRDPVSALLTQVFASEHALNSLDWKVDLCVAGPRFFILTPSSLSIIRYTTSGWEEEKVTAPPDRQFTCITLRSTNRDTKLILGTRQRSLIFLSSKGEFESELFLTDVATALHVVEAGSEGPEIIAGLAQGNLAVYRLISSEYIERLGRLCSEERDQEHLQQWRRHDFVEQLALIALAQAQTQPVAHVYQKLDEKIRLLIPEDQFLAHIQSLEQQHFIEGHVESTEVHYSIGDDDYADWVKSRQDFLKTLRDHHEQVVDAIDLMDVSRIDAAFTKEEGKNWVREFLLIDREKWNDLGRLCEVLNALEQHCSHPKVANAAKMHSLHNTHLQLLCANIKAMFRNPVSVDDEVSANLWAFEMQMPGIKFRGFDRILVVMLSEQFDHRKSLSWIQLCPDWRIVVVLTPREKELLRAALASQPRSIAVLNHHDLKSIGLDESPRDAFLNRLVDQFNISALSPFQTAGPVDEMFYGREHECELILNSVLHPGAKSYAVIGPRRIGKTSLLQHVLRHVEANREFRTVFLDSSPYGANLLNWCNAVLNRLKSSERCRDVADFIPMISHFCAANRCKLALFIDEVDNFVETDQIAHDKFSRMLRALVNEQNVKLVIAGYRELYLQMYDVDSPLFNLLEKIELSSLESRDAFALANEPLANLFYFERKDIEYITEKTGCYPNFIQFCCNALIQHPNVRATRVITGKDIDEILRSPQLYDHMIDVYLKNLDDQSEFLLHLIAEHFDENLRRTITDGPAHRQACKSGDIRKKKKFELGERFTPYELMGLLQSYGVIMDHRQLETLMKKLVLATVLKHEVDSREYSFVLPDMPIILRRHVEVDLALINLLERKEAIFGK